MNSTAIKKVEAFRSAAMTYGWESDQGSAKSALSAQRKLNKAQDALEMYITHLQNKIKFLQRRKTK